MPVLNWIGKEKVISHHMDVPFRVLEHRYRYPIGFNRTEDEGGVNKIIFGDNLEALKALLPEYQGRIKCIYIDPPYNTGNENWVYNDNVNSPVIRRWLGQVVGAESEDLSRHDKWLCMMYPRLQLLHKLLADDGAIFISIDDNELSHLRLVMDEIFGAGNFIDYFSWKKSETPANLSHKSKKAIEYIVCYQKKRNSVKFKGLQKESGSDNPLIKPGNSTKILHFKKEWVFTNFKKKEKFLKGFYGTSNNKVELLNDLEIENGNILADFSLKANFIWLQEKLEDEVSNGTQIRIKTKTLIPSYEKSSYAPEVPWNLIDASFNVGTTQEGGDILTAIFGEKVFDFPKTPSLIEYLINFLCSENDIILDSFAGSGTTAHAVLNLNRKDGGNRKFILIEMNPYAETITAERVRRVIAGYSPEPGTGGAFDFYELGPALFTADNELNEMVGLTGLRQYIYYTETGELLKDNVKNDNPYFLGVSNNCAYYFYYENNRATALNHEFLSQIATRAVQYIIYADKCLLSDEFILKHNITFKKIPRDISKF
jgi:adenine-specific DNA-methyltransferase